MTWVFYVQEIEIECWPAVVSCELKLLKKTVENSSTAWHIVCREHYYASLYHILGSVTQHCAIHFSMKLSNMHCPTWSASIATGMSLCCTLAQAGLFGTIKLLNKNKHKKQRYFTGDWISCFVLKYIQCLAGLAIETSSVLQCVWGGTVIKIHSLIYNLVWGLQFIFIGIAWMEVVCGIPVVIS